MKILITNHSLSDYTGSELYCYYLSKELSKNNTIYIFSRNYGKLSEEMSSFATLLSEPQGDFDAILYNHNNTFSDHFKSKCRIYTVHGIFPDLEKPVLGLDAYVAISHEIKEHYKNIDMEYIPNGIDTDIFKPSNKIISEKPKKNLLFLSNYPSNLSRLLFFVTFTLGIGYRHVGGGNNSKFNIVDDINWADVVVGVGRTALDAMSCNKKIILADKRGYANFGMDGYLTKEKLETSSFYNFSGRGFKKSINFFSIRKEIKKALNDTEFWERDYIIENHNIVKIAKSYISLINNTRNKK